MILLYNYLHIYLTQTRDKSMNTTSSKNSLEIM